MGSCCCAVRETTGPSEVSLLRPKRSTAQHIAMLPVLLHLLLERLSQINPLRACVGEPSACPLRSWCLWVRAECCAPFCRPGRVLFLKKDSLRKNTSLSFIPDPPSVSTAVHSIGQTCSPLGFCSQKGLSIELKQLSGASAVTGGKCREISFSNAAQRERLTSVFQFAVAFCPCLTSNSH